MSGGRGAIWRTAYWRTAYWRTAYWRTTAWSLLFGAVLLGCRSNKNDDDDRLVRRSADKARTEYYNGDDPKSVRDYLLAVKRAWLIDDPEQISHETYNLAAVMTSVGAYAEARDWLCEARAEARRADLNEAEIWLLDAKCARQMGCLEAAAQMTEYAACQASLRHRHWHRNPADVKPPATSHLAGKALAKVDHHHQWWHKAAAAIVPGHEKAKEAEQDVEQRQAARAQVALLRANLACDVTDLGTARNELASARRQLPLVANRAVHAEAERVEGRIQLISARPQAAGERFDLEADLLRKAEVYREIPYASFDAGECYDMASESWLAADRYLRAARMLYACEAWCDAVLSLEQALPLIEALCDSELAGRARVVHMQLLIAIELEVRKEKKPARRTTNAPQPTTAPQSGAAPQPAPPGTLPEPADEATEAVPHGALRQTAPPAAVPQPPAAVPQPPAAIPQPPVAIPQPPATRQPSPAVQPSPPAAGSGLPLPPLEGLRQLRQRITASGIDTPDSRLAQRLHRPKPGRTLYAAPIAPPDVPVRR